DKRTEIGVIRALVLGESNIAVDAKYAGLWIEPGNLRIELSDPRGQLASQRNDIVIGLNERVLMRIEPIPAIVFRQLFEKIDRFFPEHIALFEARIYWQLACRFSRRRILEDKCHSNCDKDQADRVKDQLFSNGLRRKRLDRIVDQIQWNRNKKYTRNTEANSRAEPRRIRNSLLIDPRKSKAHDHVS